MKLLINCLVRKVYYNLLDITAKLIVLGDKYVTTSLIIPAVVGIKMNIEKQKVTTELAEKLQRCLLNSVDKRLFPYEQRHTLQLATLLDPRLKHFAFESTENVRNAKKLLQDELGRKIWKNKSAAVVS